MNNDYKKTLEKVAFLVSKGKRNDQIAKELNRSNNFVSAMKVLLGLASSRSAKPLDEGYRSVGLDQQKNFFRINVFYLSSIQERLGLNPEKKYEFIVTNIKKVSSKESSFTISIQERNF